MTISRYRAPMIDHRTAAIARTQRAFRWTATGAVTAVAVIFGVVANELPGRSAAATAPPSTAPVATTAPPSTPSSPVSTGGSIQGSASPSPPTTAPAPTHRAPIAVSGATGW